MNIIKIQTAHNVEISYELNDLGKRIIAFMIDLFIVMVISTLSAFFFNAIRFYRISSSDIIVMLITSTPPFLYTPVMSTLTNGQTFGKMVLGLRVIKLDGTNASFFSHVIRQLLLSVDTVFGIVGILTAYSTAYKQRVGDLLAGTIVISTKYIQNTIETAEAIYAPMYDKVILLSSEDMHVVQELIQKGKNASPEVLSKTVASLKTILQVEDVVLSDLDFLQQVQKDYSYKTQQNLI